MTIPDAVDYATAACDGLAYTGQPILALVILGGLCVVAGLVLLLVKRNRGRAAIVATLAVICIGLTVSDGGGSTARASVPDCVAGQPADVPNGGEGPAESPFGIDQTNTVLGLAPGVPPAPIIGRITNHSADTAFVGTVTVSIGVVTKARTAAPGTCDATDYVLVGPAMVIDRRLLPGESVDFGGAAIGFNNKSLNQDACQAAELSLVYVSSQ